MRETYILMFERFRMDLRDERLWDGEDAVRLTNKAFSVLRHLAQHPARLVTKDELLDAVWPDTVVSEAAMTVCIRELRQALGDDARAPRFIETVRGRGYRFVAPVSHGPLAEPPHLVETRVAPVSQGSRTRPVFLVGREAEMARLHEWLARALEGKRCLGFVGGEAGIGKTSVVDAFVAQVERDTAPWIGHGQCVDQYGAGEPYLPLLEALGRLCRQNGGDRLLVLLRQHAPSWLAQMPGLLSETERQALLQVASGMPQGRMLRELAEAVEALTAEQSLILVLEDLHWCDASTLAWLGYIARRREAARLLVLGTYRPVQAIVVGHPLRELTHELRGRGQCEELLLDYLSEAAVVGYLEGRCPGGAPPPGLAHVLYRRTEGNPLFLVTLVDTLVRQGALVEDPSGWGLPDGLEAVSTVVPDSLRKFIEQRLEQTDTLAQPLLEAASVVGMEFSAAAVAAGTGDAEDEVEARCEALARRGQFVCASGAVAWPDGTVASRYRFIHALYPEVLYNRLPAGQRARLHRQIGLRLERAHAERATELAAELAEHFVRGRDAQRAVHYLGLAGESARQRSAYREAIGHLTRGLEMLGSVPEEQERARQELALQTSLGTACTAAKGYAAPEVGAAFGRALELCRHLDVSEHLVPVLRGLWVYHLVRAEFQAARKLAEQLLDFGERTRDPAALGSAHHGLGQILYHTGEFVSAREHCEQALALFHRLEAASPAASRAFQDGRVITLGALALSLWHLGYPDQALDRATEALALARDLAHPFTLVSALHVAVIVHRWRAEKALARDLNEEMLALSLEQVFPPFVAGGTFAKTAMLVEQGGMDPLVGLEQMQRGVDAYRAAGVQSGFPETLTVLAMVQGALGRVEAALATLAEARTVVEATGEWRHESALCLLRGDLLCKQAVQSSAAALEGVAAEAEACFHQAIDAARQQQAKSLELLAALSLGRLWLHQGKHDEARGLLAEVCGWFTEGFDTGDLRAARVLLEELAPT